MSSVRSYTFTIKGWQELSSRDLARKLVVYEKLQLSRSNWAAFFVDADSDTSLCLLLLLSLLSRARRHSLVRCGLAARCAMRGVNRPKGALEAWQRSTPELAAKRRDVVGRQTKFLREKGASFRLANRRRASLTACFASTTCAML